MRFIPYPSSLILCLALWSSALAQNTPGVEAVPAYLPPGVPTLADFPAPQVQASICHASSRGKVTFASGPSELEIPQRGQVAPEGLYVKTGAQAFLTLSLSNGVTLKLGENSSMRFEEFRQADLPADGLKTEEAFPSRLRIFLDEGTLFYAGPKLRSQSFVTITTTMGIAHIQGGQAHVEARLRPGFTDEVDVFTNQGLVFIHPGSFSRPPETIKPMVDNICELRQSTKLNPVTTAIRTHQPEFLKNCQEQFLRMNFASSRIIWSKAPGSVSGSPSKLVATAIVPASLLATDPAVRYTP